MLEDNIVLRSDTLVLATDDELEQQRREGRERTLDVRFARIHAFIADQIIQRVARILFEDVEFASTRMQAQLCSSFRTALWAVALRNPHLSVFGLPVYIEAIRHGQRPPSQARFGRPPVEPAS